jgi:hypothetical protein
MNLAVSSRACVLPAFYWLMPSLVPMQTRRMRDKLSSGTINMFYSCFTEWHDIAFLVCTMHFLTLATTELAFQ